MFSVFLFLVIFISMCLFVYEDHDLSLQFVQATDVTAFRQYEFVQVFDPIDLVGIDFFATTDSPVQVVRAQEEKTIVSAETPIPEHSSININVNEAIPTTKFSDAITITSSAELAAVKKEVSNAKKSRKKETTDDTPTKTKTTRKSKAKKEVENKTQAAA